MGHDVHFLERLSRVEAEDESLALSLYQDPELVRTILSLAQLPDGAERVALALQEDPEGPHVVVARDGGFVTCLGSGMSTGPVPILTRHQLEGMRVRAERVRAAFSFSESVLGDKSPGGRPISGRLTRVGPAATRADYKLVTTFLPLNCADLLSGVFGLFETLLEAYAKARPLLKQRKVTRSADIELLRNIYFGTWAIGHYLVVIASDPQLFKPASERLLANFNPLAMGMSLRSLPIIFRTLWATSRFAPLCFKLQRHRLEEALEPDSLDCAALSMAIAGCRHSKLRDEAVRLLERARRVPVEGVEWELYRNKTLTSCIHQLDKDLDLEVLKQASRELVGKALVSSGWADHIDTVSDELLRWSLVTCEGPFDHFGVQLVRSFFPLIAEFDGSDFFVPREYETVFRAPKTVPLDVVLDLVREDRLYRAIRPVTRGARPSRNAPCHCGSGQKYKACCAANESRSSTEQSLGPRKPKRRRSRAK